MLSKPAAIDGKKRALDATAAQRTFRSRAGGMSALFKAVNVKICGFIAAHVVNLQQ
jgi:hypothetical protein